MVDVYAGVAVAVSSAIWLENWSDAVRDALLELPEVTSVVWRRNLARLKQDGWDARLKQDGGDADDEQQERPAATAEIAKPPEKQKRSRTRWPPHRRASISRLSRWSQ